MAFISQIVLCQFADLRADSFTSHVLIRILGPYGTNDTVRGVIDNSHMFSV